MRLLFATGRMLYPFFRGGDGTTVSQMLKALHRHGIECLALGKLDPMVATYSHEAVIKRLEEQKISYKFGAHGLSFWNNIENRLLNSVTYLEEVVNVIKDFKPSIILTQLEDSEKIIRLAYIYKIPCILYVHDATEANYNSLSEPGLSFVFYNSKFISDKFLAFHHIPNTVIYPIVDPEYYVSDKSISDFITMVNPISSKGGEIVKECCRILPNIPFQIVLGWESSKVNFSKFENAKIIKFGLDMRSIYSRTRFVIAPSIGPEAFCRIPVEAGLNNIPTIANRVGGLEESVGNGGILVDDYTNVEEWAERIKNLYHDQILSGFLGKLACENAQKFTPDYIISLVINLIFRIVK